MDLKNKRIVITGATSGLGQQLMVTLSKYDGVRIIAVGRRMRNIPIDMNIIPYKADISNQEEVDALFDFAQKKIGGIDIFIANAGVGHFENSYKTSWENIEQIFKTNVFSPIYSAKKMIDLHKNNSEKFLIAITASGRAKLPIPSNPLYVASKAALDGFSSVVQYNLPKTGRISTIYPLGITHTNFFEELMYPEENGVAYGRKQSRKYVANKIIRGIEKEKKTIYTCPFFRIKLFFYHLFPFLFTCYFNHQEKKRKENI